MPMYEMRQISPSFILIGLQGVGKTTLVEQIAQQLFMNSFDLDRAIVERVGQNRTPRHIFSEIGSVRFRSLEKELFFEFMCGIDSPTLVSIGGGAFHLFEEHTIPLSSIIYLFEEIESFCARMLKKYAGMYIEDLPGWLQNQAYSGRNLDTILRAIWKERHSRYSSIQNHTILLKNGMVDLQIIEIIESKLQQWRAIVSDRL